MDININRTFPVAEGSHDSAVYDEQEQMISLPPDGPPKWITQTVRWSRNKDDVSIFIGVVGWSSDEIDCSRDDFIVGVGRAVLHDYSDGLVREMFDEFDAEVVVQDDEVVL